MNQNQQPGSADPSALLTVDRRAAIAAAVRKSFPTDLAGDGFVAQLIWNTEQACLAAIAASRRASPSLPDVAMPDKEPETPLRPVILRAKLRAALEDPMSADFAEVSKNTLRNVLKALAAQPAEGSAQVAQDWISVDERLPEEMAHVAILYWPYNNRENAQIVGWAEYVEGTFYTHEGDEHHPPSHWMNLPEFPRIDGDKQGAQGDAS